LSNWHKIELGEVGNIITGKTPPTKDKDNYGNEYMFIGPTDLHKHFILKSSEKMISKKGLDTIKGSILEGTSILVGCIGWDMGNVAIITKKCATNQQINSITNIKKEYNPLFIYYWLKNKKDFLFSIANVTRTPILNKTDFSKIAINVPTKNYQDKIVSILSSLDKKIELNDQINQKLEAMSKTLYNYWFVQFDFPDTNGKPYKSSGGKMVYSEELKREIPKGWEVKKLVDIESNIVTGKTPSTKKDEYYNGGVPFISIGDIRGNMHVVSTEATLTKEGADTQIKKYIPKGSICVSCIASPGLIGFVTQDSQTNQQINSIVCSQFENRFYLYFALKDYFKFSSAKTGNTFANMNKQDFSEIPLVYPMNKTLQKFSKILEPSIDKILNNSLENKKLTQLRDWLLPMLMNGQVKVVDATEMVDELMVAEPSVEYGES